LKIELIFLNLLSCLNCNFSKYAYAVYVKSINLNQFFVVRLYSRPIYRLVSFNEEGIQPEVSVSCNDVPLQAYA